MDDAKPSGDEDPPSGTQSDTAPSQLQRPPPATYKITADLDDAQVQATIVDVVDRQFGAEIDYKKAELQAISTQLERCTTLLHRLRQTIARGHATSYPKTNTLHARHMDHTHGPTIPLAGIKREAEVDGDQPRKKQEISTQGGPEMGGTEQSGESRTQISNRGQIGEPVTTPANTPETARDSFAPTQPPLVGRSIAVTFRHRRLFARRPDGVYVQLQCPVCAYEKFPSTTDLERHCFGAHGKAFPSASELLSQCGRCVAESLVPVDDMPRHDQKTHNTPPPSVVPVSTNEEKGGSRFYVTKTIIVGNTSKYIPEHKRDPANRSTHKWMMYVRGPREEPHIHTFVKKVWFFLHPSYKPHDVVEINSPPFHLSRHGWGEFPVRVQLHFHNGRNKAVDIIHHLKLDRTFTGHQMLGSETTVKVEIDRRNQLQQSEAEGMPPSSDLASTHAPPSDSEHEPRSEADQSQMDDESLLSLDDDIPLDLQQQLLAEMSKALPISLAQSHAPAPGGQSGTSSPSTNQVGGKHLPGQTPPISTPTVRTVRFADTAQSDTDSADASQSKPGQATGLGKGKKPRNVGSTADGAANDVGPRKEPEGTSSSMSQDQLLHALVKQCLIIVPNPTDSEGRDYPQARSLSEYLRWAPNKRSNAEYLRARHMKELAKGHGQHIKTAAIMAWCRENGFTPVPSALAAGAGYKYGKVVHCKYCGLAHIDSISTAADASMTECGYWHRLLRPSGKYHANSLSVADDLVKELQVLQAVADEDEDMDLDVATWDGLPADGSSPYAADASHPPEVVFLRHTIGQLGLALADGDFTVDHLLYAAMSQFVQQLVSASVGVQRAQSHPDTAAMQPAHNKATAKKLPATTAQQVAPGPGPGLLLPGHVYRAITQTPSFDFLTNAYMATDPNAAF